MGGEGYRHSTEEMEEIARTGKIIPCGAVNGRQECPHLLPEEPGLRTCRRQAEQAAEATMPMEQEVAMGGRPGHVSVS